MNPPESTGPERTLDPEDWSETRGLGHELLDELFDWLETVRERPAWQPVPADARTRLDVPPPYESTGIAEILADLKQDILPYPTGNVHPRFFGWVHGTGTVEGALAELAAGFMNCNVGGRDHAAVYVERQVIAWLTELFGFPRDSTGLLVSGTSMATLLGLAVARERVAPGKVRSEGVAASLRPLVAYASAEAHVSVRKALELLGLGGNALRRVPVDESFRMDPRVLKEMVAADRSAGYEPFCVVGTAGTVTTGAIDDLAAVADVCFAEGLWLHVDAAFGGALMMCEDLRPRLAGIERADSLAFDLHKWMHVPYDAGCVLVRDAEAHRATFSADRDYLGRFERGTGAGDPWYTDFGPELSRGFRALKVWVTLRAHGLDRIGEMVEKNCEQATYLAARVAERDGWVVAAPVGLNIVCFRVEPPADSGLDPDEMSREIVMRVQESGVAVPSTVEISSQVCIRVAITNHRTQRADLDLFLEAVETARRDILEDGPQ